MWKMQAVRSKHLGSPFLSSLFSSLLLSERGNCDLVLVSFLSYRLIGCYLRLLLEFYLFQFIGYKISLRSYCN